MTNSISQDLQIAYDKNVETRAAMKTQPWKLEVRQDFLSIGYDQEGYPNFWKLVRVQASMAFFSKSPV